MDVTDEPPVASQQAGERRPRGWRRWLAVAVASVAVVAVVATFGAIALARAGSVGGINGAGALPKGWHVYHDPLGLFTMDIPPGWIATAHVDGPFYAGSPAGSFSGNTESAEFRDPEEGSASADIGIVAWQLTSSSARAAYCGDWGGHETATLNGYRAESVYPPGTVWLLESYNAHFQIDVTIPGVLIPIHTEPLMTTIPPTPTPLPQSVIHADRALLATALASFKPAAKPLTCS